MGCMMVHTRLVTVCHFATFASLASQLTTKTSSSSHGATRKLMRTYPDSTPQQAAAPAPAEEDNFSIFRRPVKSSGSASAAETQPDPAKLQHMNMTDLSSDTPSQQDQGVTATGGLMEHPAPDEVPGDDAQQPENPVEQQPTAAPEPEPQLTPEQEADMLSKAEALKQEGNQLYGEGKHAEAIQKYAAAVEAAPPSASKQRAVYLANMAACDVALKEYKEAVQACSAAIEEDPTYIKAYMRRGVAHKELDDLEHALADARKVVELDPGNSWAMKTVKELEPIVTERQEKLKTEMLGKLKDLGNTILGKFGMSLDNFKLDKDANTGGYSIRYQQ